MGGESYPRSDWLKDCRKKKNVLFLSHSDTDHLNFISRYLRYSRKFCADSSVRALLKDESTLRLQPRQQAALARRHVLLKKLPTCHRAWRVVESLYKRNPPHNRMPLKSANDRSSIYLLKNQFLFTGDSTRAQEAIWAPAVRHWKHLRVYVLGHHGSRTSTSDQIVSRLRSRTMAVVSARKKRYGHPHFEVLFRLNRAKVPVLKTETWGNLIFEI